MTPFFNGNSQPLQVSTARIELMFKDGTCVSVHSVLSQGAPDRYLRAVPHASGHHLVDLRNIAPALGDELCTVDAGDVNYLVFMTLKLRFKCADDFMNAVLNHRMRSEEATACLH